MVKLPVVSRSGTILKRREFVTHTAALLISGAVLPGCDEEIDLAGCDEETGVDDPACPDVGDPDADATAEPPEVATEPDFDELRILRSYE